MGDREVLRLFIHKKTVNEYPGDRTQREKGNALKNSEKKRRKNVSFIRRCAHLWLWSRFPCCHLMSQSRKYERNRLISLFFGN